MFGVGPYSFAPFKVAICGLHKAPVFRAVGPVEGRPAMFDDTCYFLPCSSAEEAAALAALCNDPMALAMIRSASFPEAKRPITKALLQRLDLRAILDRTDRRELLARAEAILADDLGFTAGEAESPRLDRIEEALASLRQDPMLV